jgi:DNA polymerase III epsilon subunit-like protein
LTTSATNVDTLEEEVTQVTYKPPVFPSSFDEPFPTLPTEKDYLQFVLNPHHEAPFDAHIPAELFLAKELSNPHSRAKKQLRWQAALQRKRQLRKDFLDAEKKTPMGRDLREMKAEANWKYREALAQEEKEKRRTKWIQRGAEGRLQRKITRKARKEMRKARRLTELTLEAAPQQYLPPHVSQN